MATLHAYYHEHVLLDSLINMPSLGNGARKTCWHFLAQSPSMEIESIPSNSAGNTCWHFLVQSPTMEIESILSNGARNDCCIS